MCSQFTKIKPNSIIILHSHGFIVRSRLHLSVPKPSLLDHSQDSTIIRVQSYLVNIQSLHGIFDQLDVDLSLFGLKLLVGNELGF